MKVYAVLTEYDEGGGDILGLYTTREAAEEHKFLETGAGAWGVSVSELEVQEVLCPHVREALTTKAREEAERVEAYRLREKARLDARTPEQVEADEAWAVMGRDLARYIDEMYCGSYVPLVDRLSKSTFFRPEGRGFLWSISMPTVPTANARITDIRHPDLEDR